MSSKWFAMAPPRILKGRVRSEITKNRQQFAAELLALYTDELTRITSWSVPARTSNVWIRLALPD